MQGNILDAKNQLSQLVKAAQAGVEVVIANRGRPVARWVGVAAPTSEPAGIAAWLDANPLPTHAQRRAPEIDEVQPDRPASASKGAVASFGATRTATPAGNGHWMPMAGSSQRMAPSQSRV
jgi:prevent-host-death family protein